MLHLISKSLGPEGSEFLTVQQSNSQRKKDIRKNYNKMLFKFYLPVVTESVSHSGVLLKLQFRDLKPVFYQELLV